MGDDGRRMGGRFARRAAVAVALLGWAAAACTPEAAPRPRHVLLVSIDTLRADAVETLAAGDASVAALLARAAVFDDAVSPASWTLPAHASLFTGRYPDAHGAVHPATRLPPELPTLAAVLRARGHATVAFTGGGYIDPHYGLGAGFDTYAVDVRDPRRAARGEGHLGLARAAAWLQARPADAAPFLLFAHTFAVHDFFQPGVCAPPAGAGRPRGVDCLRGQARCADADWARLRACYAEAVAASGRELGDLLRALDARGLSSETLVVLTSDHGEGFEPARRRLHHGGRLEADVLRVPLVIAGPGVSPGARRAPASLVDVLPTVLAALGVDAPAGLDGVALPLREDAVDATRVRYAMEHHRAWNATGLRLRGSPHPTLHAIAVVTDQAWYVRDARGEQLYAAGDRAQADDLAARDPRRAALAALAEARAAGQAPPAPTAALSPALRERLRALGYDP